MFGLMTIRAHESALSNVENAYICIKKSNEMLKKRIRLGEDYRSRLELEITSVKEANIRLLHEKEELERELMQTDHALREARLMCGSLEAHLSARQREEVNEA